MSSLQGKNALVTGGTRGIGGSTARKLAAEGANVAITYGQSKDEAEAHVAELTSLGVTARAYQADAASPENLAAVLKQIIADFGSIDILVNNAGTFSGGAIGEIDPEEYRRIMATNVDAVFTTTQAVLGAMPDGGRIINIGSVLGERATVPGISIYNASKFAVAGFTRSWAHDLAERNILVNVVQPGPIDTVMNPADSEMADHMRGLTALKRYGKAEEVAAAVVFLASPQASYMTGATINVDGGWNA